MPFNVNIEDRVSPLHGRGLYATVDIPRGTKVWSFLKCPECPKSQTGESQNAEIHQSMQASKLLGVCLRMPTLS